MRNLQNRIALILASSIVAVMLIAMGVTAAVLISGESSRMIDPMARHISGFSGEYEGTVGNVRPPPPRRDRISDSAPTDPLREDLTTALGNELVARGVSGTVQVTQAEGADPVVALEMPDGRWMLFAFPEPIGPPPELWVGILSWLGVTVVGVVAVALVMARRVTRPFAVLEQAVASVGPDGVLPHMPEVGSGETRQTAVALNALSDRLRAGMESRMRLVAAAGHDLRTPMTRMRLRAEFLPDDERNSWLSDIDELEAIADSAIRIVREEAAGADREPVALDTVVAEIAADLRDAGLPVEIVSSVPVTVLAGPLALRRALRNLVTNAATHGQGAQLSIQEDDTSARLIIEDNGPGIPEAMLTQVFEPFFRASPGRMQITKGAGLGLAIAREIIERFGGTIEISNRPGSGLRQCVTLKRAESQQGAPQ